jgi:hypothetical protein
MRCRYLRKHGQSRERRGEVIGSVDSVTQRSRRGDLTRRPGPRRDGARRVHYLPPARTCPPQHRRAANPGGPSGGSPSTSRSRPATRCAASATRSPSTTAPDPHDTTARTLRGDARRTCRGSTGRRPSYWCPVVRGGEELCVMNRRQRVELRLRFQGPDPQRAPAIRTVSRW